MLGRATLLALSTMAAATGPTPAAGEAGPFAYANVDPTDDDVVGPPKARATCTADLAAAGIDAEPVKMPVLSAPGRPHACGAPQAVFYRRSPEAIEWAPTVLVTCSMALALARFETVVQEEAQRVLERKVVKIRHLGTFDCRDKTTFPGFTSEHAFANAIDVEAVVLDDGTVVDVLRHFAPKSEVPPTLESAFLRSVARRLYDEDVFSSVITPFFDRFHVDHFHLDLARTRFDGAAFGKPREH